jgi:ParB family transcriptional regulator, chromosome partitioning protein
MQATTDATAATSIPTAFENLWNPEVNQIQVLSLSQLVLGAYQPRKHFDPKKLDELTVSIRSHGVLQPIVVRPIEPERFEIIAGERRYMASQRAGLKSIPAVIKRLDDREALEVALLVNLQRQDLTEIEETEGVLHLLSLRLERSLSEAISLLYRMDNESKGKVTQSVLGSPDGCVVESVFSTLGKMTWQSFVVTRLPLLKLPHDLLEALRRGEITPIKARTLSRLTDPTERRRMLDDLLREGWSNMELRHQIAALHGDDQSRDVQVAVRLRAFETSMHRNHTWVDDARRQRAEVLLRELEQLLKAEGFSMPSASREAS